MLQARSEYRAADPAVLVAGDALEDLDRRIAATPASGKPGLRAKAQLLAMAYGLDLGRSARARDREDLGATLIRSLFADFARKSGFRP